MLRTKIKFNQLFKDEKYNYTLLGTQTQQHLKGKNFDPTPSFLNYVYIIYFKIYLP